MILRTKLVRNKDVKEFETIIAAKKIGTCFTQVLHNKRERPTYVMRALLCIRANKNHNAKLCLKLVGPMLHIK